MTIATVPQWPQELSHVRASVSSEEWHARVELAALYRLIAHFRLTDTIYTHISMRVPGPHGANEAFLINPFGLLYEEITASSLVKITVDGEILHDPTGFGINRAGFVIHGAIHAARPDVNSVLHTHTRAGIAVSAQEGGLLPISQHAAQLIGRVSYHDFEGIAVDLEERKRLVADLGANYMMILNNHGLLTAGRSAGETLQLMLFLERACDAQVAALSGGTSVRIVTEQAIESTARTMAAAGGNFSRDWAAMLRLANRIGPDFQN